MFANIPRSNCSGEVFLCWEKFPHSPGFLELESKLTSLPGYVRSGKWDTSTHQWKSFSPLVISHWQGQLYSLTKHRTSLGSFINRALRSFQLGLPLCILWAVFTVFMNIYRWKYNCSLYCDSGINYIFEHLSADLETLLKLFSSLSFLRTRRRPS